MWQCTQRVCVFNLILMCEDWPQLWLVLYLVSFVCITRIISRFKCKALGGWDTILCWCISNTRHSCSSMSSQLYHQTISYWAGHWAHTVPCVEPADLFTSYFLMCASACPVLRMRPRMKVKIYMCATHNLKLQGDPQIEYVSCVACFVRLRDTEKERERAANILGDTKLREFAGDVRCCQLGNCVKCTGMSPNSEPKNIPWTCPYTSKSTCIKTEPSSGTPIFTVKTGLWTDLSTAQIFADFTLFLDLLCTISCVCLLFYWLGLQSVGGQPGRSKSVQRLKN